MDRQGWTTIPTIQLAMVPGTLWLSTMLMALCAFLWLSPSAGAQTAYSNKCAAFVSISYSGDIAGDAANTTSQKSVDCFAWQQFIALNWPTAGQRFGTPLDRSPVQWQTFPSEADVFRTDDAPASSHGRAPLPAACAARVKAAGFSKPENLTILQAPAGPGQKPPRINGTEQAGASDTQAGWVGASNNTNLWYEIRLNREEADFIAANRLDSADGQAAFIAEGHPLLLPKGALDDATGAIELKAAWMEVPDPGNPKWAYFKTGDAAILDAAGRDCRLTQVALVGLHIIQKTRRQPTYFWATFEHIDNVPDENGPISGSYNLYNNHCQPQKVVVDAPGCLAGEQDPAALPGVPRVVTVSCTPNTRPPYHIGGACPAPRATQTVRLIPLQADVMEANRMVQASIAKNHPNSVWQYYKLVNVQWSPSPASDPESPRPVPARMMATLPAIPVANTTMETYRQTTSCTVCHVNGALTNPSNISADFSFVFQAAGR